MTEETERIAILLQARDRDLQRALDRSNKLLSKFEQNAGRSATRTGRTVERNLARVGTSFKAFAGGLVGGAIAAGLAAVTSELAGTIKGIAAIGDEARRSGLGVEAFQELKFVAEQSRIPVDALIDGMKELNLRADEFVTTGKGSAAEAFQRLGYGARDLKQRLEDPKELMLDIIDRMEDLDRAAQIRVADEIFGGTGGERFVELLAQGDDGIRKLIGRAHELGAVMDEEAIQKAAELDRRFEALRTRLSSMFKEATVNVASFISDLAVAGDRLEEIVELERARKLLGDEAAAALQASPAAAEEAGAAILQANQEMTDLVATARTFARTLADEVPNLVELGLEDEAIALADMVDEVERLSGQWERNEIGASDLRDRLGEVVSRAVDAADEVASIDGVTLDAVIGHLGRLAGMLATVAARARDAVAAAGGTEAGGADEPSLPSGPPRRADHRRATEGLAPKTSPRPKAAPAMIHESSGTGGGAGGGRKGGGGSRPDAWTRELERTREEIARLELEAASLVVAASYGQELGDAFDYARKRAELLHAAQQDGRAITPALTAEVDQLARAYVAAGMEAEAAEDRMDRVAQAAERGADAMTDLFGSVLEGSMSAKEAVASLLSQLARASLTRGISAMSGAGGFFGWLGGLLTPRAGGGPVRAGQPYLVNENTSRSELFVPSQSGAVLNVPQAQAALRQSGGASGPVDVRVLGGDLTLSDGGSIMARVQVVADSRIRQAQPALTQAALSTARQSKRYLR